MPKLEPRVLCAPSSLLTQLRFSLMAEQQKRINLTRSALPKLEPRVLCAPSPLLTQLKVLAYGRAPYVP